MSEFNLDFSRHLIKTAQIIANNDLSDIEAKRTVLYLSLLSSEISLKALLEKSGISISRLKKLSHSHKKLIEELEKEHDY